MPESALYLSDLMTGLFAAFALRRIPSLSLRGGRFDRALERLTDDIAKEADAAKLQVRFRVQTHPVHRDSVAIQQALYEAAKRDLVSLDNPEFQDVRLKITSEDAPLFLRRLPGTPEMYERLADKVIRYYETA